MKRSPEPASEKGLAWQQEVFRYLEGLTSGRIAERQAPAEKAAADSDLATVPVSSGVSEFDARLGGGFFPGLWMIVGEPGADKTTFLESVAWEAVAYHRAVVYYALIEGAEAVRERLLGILAFIMADGGDSTPSGHAERRSDSERVADLDPTVWPAVFSRVWVVDSLPAGPEPVSGFLRSLERTLGDVASRVGHVPVVLIDDLATLLGGLGVESAMGAARVMAGLDGALVRCASAGLMAADPELTTLLPPLERAKAKGLVQLGHGRIELQSRSPLRLDVTIHENPHATWRGTLPLVLHSSVGVFTLAV
jgi:hypothetical protein